MNTLKTPTYEEKKEFRMRLKSGIESAVKTAFGVFPAPWQKDVGEAVCAAVENVLKHMLPTAVEPIELLMFNSSRLGNYFRGKVSLISFLMEKKLWHVRVEFESADECRDAEVLLVNGDHMPLVLDVQSCFDVSDEEIPVAVLDRVRMSGSGWNGHLWYIDLTVGSMEVPCDSPLYPMFAEECRILKAYPSEKRETVGEPKDDCSRSAADIFREIESIGPCVSWEDVFKSSGNVVLMCDWSHMVLGMILDECPEDYDVLLKLAGDSSESGLIRVLCDFYIPWNRVCDGTDARCYWWSVFISADAWRTEKFLEIKSYFLKKKESL